MLDPHPYWAGKPVCVTGGTGFLGWHLVGQLLRAGARVRVLALRPPPDHPVHAAGGVEAFFGDVLDGGLLRRALAGCDVVFHAAGPVAVWGPALGRMHQVHVEGTRAV